MKTATPKKKKIFKFKKQYREHLEKIEKAQEAFDKNPCQMTAIPLSNLKNNEFRKPEEVFRKEYIESITPETIEDEEVSFEIVYESAHSHIASDLKVVIL